MKHRIFQYTPPHPCTPTEVERFQIFANRVGHTCYYLEVSKFDRHPGTQSGWVKRAYDPQTKEWIEFPYCSHYCHFDIFNISSCGPERALAVYLIPENEDEENLVMNCQTCVKWEPWAFRVCLIPDLDFFPSGSNQTVH